MKRSDRMTIPAIHSVSYLLQSVQLSMSNVNFCSHGFLRLFELSVTSVATTTAMVAKRVPKKTDLP
jgi:hypothetical protein